VETILQPQCVLTAGRLGLISRPNGEGGELRRARSLPPLHLRACTPQTPARITPANVVACRCCRRRRCVPGRVEGACMRAPCRLHPVLSRHGGPRPTLDRPSPCHSHPHPPLGCNHTHTHHNCSHVLAHRRFADRSCLVCFWLLIVLTSIHHAHRHLAYTTPPMMPSPKAATPRTSQVPRPPADCTNAPMPQCPNAQIP
jgi:hypothetical protein